MVASCLIEVYNYVRNLFFLLACECYFSAFGTFQTSDIMKNYDAESEFCFAFFKLSVAIRTLRQIRQPFHLFNRKCLQFTQLIKQLMTKALLSLLVLILGDLTPGLITVRLDELEHMFQIPMPDDQDSVYPILLVLTGFSNCCLRPTLQSLPLLALHSS